MAQPDLTKALRLLRRNPLVQISLLILLAMIVLALLAPFLPLPSPTRQNFALILKPPAWQMAGRIDHPLGTDFLGRDILSRLVWGARISLGTGFAAVAVAASIGVSLGIIAPYAGGWVDDAVMRGFDIVLAIPHILIAIAVLLITGQSLAVLIVVLGVRSTVWYARILRSRVLVLQEEQYVKAARALGVSSSRIVTRHILRNALPPVLVLTAVYVGLMIIIESSLSFLGLTRGYVSWGFMVAESRNYMATSWWTVTLPGLCIVLVVLSVNVIGDFLRDVLDPNLKLRPD
jgi:peptide/nickel transport system permease protein